MLYGTTACDCHCHRCFTELGSSLPDSRSLSSHYPWNVRPKSFSNYAVIYFSKNGNYKLHLCISRRPFRKDDFSTSWSQATDLWRKTDSNCFLIPSGLASMQLSLLVGMPCTEEKSHLPCCLKKTTCLLLPSQGDCSENSRMHKADLLLKHYHTTKNIL